MASGIGHEPTTFDDRLELGRLSVANLLVNGKAKANNAAVDVAAAVDADVKASYTAYDKTEIVNRES